MQIAVQIENGNQKLFNAIKALLSTQPKLNFKIQKVSEKEISIPALDEAIAEYENGDIIKCGSFEEYQRKMREE